MEKKQKLIKECEICNDNATNLCFKCKSYFCEHCYKVIHDLQKNPGHKKEKIDPYVSIDIKCPDHPDNPTNLFCVDEKGNLFNIKIYNRTLLCFLLF